MFCLCIVNSHKILTLTCTYFVSKNASFLFYFLMLCGVDTLLITVKSCLHKQPTSNTWTLTFSWHWPWPTFTASRALTVQLTVQRLLAVNNHCVLVTLSCINKHTSHVGFGFIFYVITKTLIICVLCVIKTSFTMVGWVTFSFAIQVSRV